MFNVLASTSTASAEPTKHTRQPILTGTSIVAIKYNGGVVMGCDTMGSYGSQAKFESLDRVATYSNTTLIGADGDYSDFQYIDAFLKEWQVEEKCFHGANLEMVQLSPNEVFHRMTTMMYQRRSKMNPLWNELVIAGVDPKSMQPFIGSTDKLGTPFETNFVATGFGLHLAQPVLEDKWRADLTEDEAVALVTECLRICYYRDARAGFKIQISKVKTDSEGKISLTKDLKILNSEWNYKAFQNSRWALPL
eukprot:augustus_masked-scaffold_7-processed-gene-2.8-mRNA-1 protein AED:0.02 eAED:0.02 QI:0/-1/0/1/-1/1/1/0/249